MDGADWLRRYSLADREQASAQSWPNGPVKMFVGFAAGGIDRHHRARYRP